MKIIIVICDSFKDTIAIHKEQCPEYKNFGKGNCECCLDAYECEKTTFAIKESNRKPINDWIDVKGD